MAVSVSLISQHGLLAAGVSGDSGSEDLDEDLSDQASKDTMNNKAFFSAHAATDTFKEDQPAPLEWSQGTRAVTGMGGGGVLSAGRTFFFFLIYLSDPLSYPQLFALTLLDRAPRSQLGDGRLCCG